MEQSAEVMEMREAFNLTGSYRDAAALAGCDHKTLALVESSIEQAPNRERGEDS